MEDGEWGRGIAGGLKIWTKAGGDFKLGFSRWRKWAALVGDIHFKNVMTLNFCDDLRAIGDYIDRRVAAQAGNPSPVSCIELGYQVSQGGLLLLHFDTRHPRPLDFHWTLHLGRGNDLELAHWAAAAEELEMNGGAVILPTGSRRVVPAGSFEVVAQIFGEALLAIALDALARGSFRPLRLREDCELMVADFDGNWDNGAEQVVSRLPAQLLPK